MSGLVTEGRALRARDVSRPSDEQVQQAADAAAALIRRAAAERVRGR
ncbi:MAG: hypothetical protein Q4G45_05350 [Actinomycetia bacterium]|nr:hypothetical protein [Actinomycetes bacterium]